jgi:hypothetical protein
LPLAGPAFAYEIRVPLRMPIDYSLDTMPLYPPRNDTRFFRAIGFGETHDEVIYEELA